MPERGIVSHWFRGPFVTKQIDFKLKGEFIPLDALIKTTGVAGSGGAAKAMVAEGQVHVDGQLELRKRCKIRVGQVIAVGDVTIRVLAE
jgi:ribosome-associated protein